MQGIEHISLMVKTNGIDFYDITAKISAAIKGKTNGNALLFAYCMHTSASLCLQEAYDASAKEDMKSFLERLVPENQEWYQHTAEGADDTTAHIKAMLTSNHLVLPIKNGELLRGQWQGVYLCEHRKLPQDREVILSLLVSS